MFLPRSEISSFLRITEAQTSSACFFLLFACWEDLLVPNELLSSGVVGLQRRWLLGSQSHTLTQRLHLRSVRVGQMRCLMQQHAKSMRMLPHVSPSRKSQQMGSFWANSQWSATPNRHRFYNKKNKSDTALQLSFTPHVWFWYSSSSLFEELNHQQQEQINWVPEWTVRFSSASNHLRWVDKCVNVNCDRPFSFFFLPSRKSTLRSFDWYWRAAHCNPQTASTSPRTAVSCWQTATTVVQQEQR